MNAVSFEYKYTLNSNPFGLVWYNFNDITMLYMDEFQCERILFGQVFGGKSNYFVKSAVLVYKSADINKILKLWCLLSF